MKRCFAGMSLALIAVCAASSQPTSSLRFEVASIKPADPQEMGKISIGMSGDPGRISYTGVSLKNVLTRAYRVRVYQVTGPSWIDSERFNITAKLPEGATQEQVPEMLQNLLADRFKLTLHRETRDQSVYALAAGKGEPRLKKSEIQPSPPGAGGPAGGGPPGGGRGGARMMTSNGHIEAQGATIPGLCDMLSNMLDRPVVDKTGIAGAYDITLDVSMDELAGMKRMGARMGPGPGGPGAGGPAPETEGGGSIFSANQSLGLKLDSKKLPIDYIVVDSAEKTPTEN
jgi:uncharacterized protein (TIGR03435 family)